MNDIIKVEYGYYVKIDGVERLEEIKSKNGMYYSENQNEDFISVLEEHSKLIKKACQYNFEFYIGENIPIKKAKKVIGINHFYGLEIFESQDLIGIYDTSLLGNGKTGYYFFNNKLCFKTFENKIERVIPYKSICEIETVYNECDKCIALKFKLDNEKVKVELVDSYIDKITLRDCIKELVLLSRGKKMLKCVDIKPSKIEAEVDEEKRSKVAAVGKFLKNVVIDLGGGAINLSDAEIENLKKSDAVGVLETLMAYSESCKDDIDIYHAKCLAWKRRGMDYKHFQSITKEQKDKYLRSFGIDTKEKREKFKKEIEEEI